MNICQAITELEKSFFPNFERDKSPLNSGYFKDYTFNLIEPMNDIHRREYGSANGGELSNKGGRPAKMASLRSSSAMTFNLLGNSDVKMKKDNAYFPDGTYSVEYEKQLPVLSKNGGNPANLDAFLSNYGSGNKACTAIFCEMKMLEWLSAPSLLKSAYMNTDNYTSPETGELFCGIIDKLISDRDSGKSKYSRYDAWQMFKHTAAVYGFAEENKERYSNIVLANIVFEPPVDLINYDKLKEACRIAVEEERKQANDFIGIMNDTENLFLKNCGIDFKITYIPVNDFVCCMEKSRDQLNYLRRYTFTGG